MSKLYFFRHAQASFGADNYDVLSPKGEQQSIELGKYLVAQNFSFNKVFVGPLQRHLDTYKLVKSLYDKNHKSIPAPIFEDGLLEHQAYDSMLQLLPTLSKTDPYVISLLEKSKANPIREKANYMLIFRYVMSNWAEGKFEVHDILSWSDFRQKVKTGLTTILIKTESRETNAVFTSGGTISSITAEALNIKEERKVVDLNFIHQNTAFTSFLFSKGEFSLFAFNELPHLEPEMITFV